VITHVNGEALGALSEKEVLQRIAEASTIDFTVEATPPRADGDGAKKAAPQPRDGQIHCHM
jgi:hypothetical protein